MPTDGITAGVDRELVLGLDIGTSSVRALGYGIEGAAVEGLEVQTAYRPVAGHDGSLTVDGNTLYEIVAAALDDLLPLVRSSGYRLSAVGTSCFWHSLMGIDVRGEPTTPVYLWGDTRSESVLGELAGRVDVDTLHQTTGCRLHSSYWPAKLLWLHQTEPQLYARSVHFVSFAEYVLQRLFGRLQVSVSMASGTGLLNTRTCRWDQSALALLPAGIGDRLSAISDSALTDMDPSLAGRWPELAVIPWFPAWGDGACSNIGATGIQDETGIVVTVGTSAAARAVSRECDTTLPPSLWRYRIDAERTILGGALSEGGNLIAWLKRTLKLPALPTAEANVADRQPDAGGLTVLPFIAGERSPDWSAGARATVSQITLATTALDILQAAMESVAYEIRLVVDAMVGLIGEPERVLAAGAALARSPVWVQMVSNVLGRSISMAPQVESSSRGAALLVLERMGQAAHIAVQAPGQPVLPKDTERYAAARKRQEQLRAAMGVRNLD